LELPLKCPARPLLKRKGKFLKNCTGQKISKKKKKIFFSFSKKKVKKNFSGEILFESKKKNGSEYFEAKCPIFLKKAQKC